MDTIERNTYSKLVAKQNDASIGYQEAPKLNASNECAQTAEELAERAENLHRMCSNV